MANFSITKGARAEVSKLGILTSHSDFDHRIWVLQVPAHNIDFVIHVLIG
jgi:hypothetical protein